MCCSACNVQGLTWSNWECLTATPSLMGRSFRLLRPGPLPPEPRQSGVLDMLRSLKGQLQIPVILFTYSNPLLNVGMEAFCQSAAEAGAAGFGGP